MPSLEAVINSDARLAVIQSTEQARVIEWLREEFNRTGKASYLWTAGDGLRRIAVEHIPIPQTVRPHEVLDHILASQHFGIYTLRDFETAFDDRRIIDKLSRIANDRGQTRKLVLLLGATTRLPPAFTGRAEYLTIT